MSGYNHGSQTLSAVRDETASKLQAALLVMNEQVGAAASKVALLADMGLSRTEGYAKAVEFYQEKVRARDDLSTKLATITGT